MKMMMTVLMLALFNTSYAATFKSTKEMTKTSLKNIYSTYEKVIAHVDDAEVKGIKIISRKPQEKWENTVKQIFKSNIYVEKTRADLLQPTVKNIEQTFNELIHAGCYIEDHTRKELHAKVLPLLKKAFSNDQYLLLVSAGFGGAFSSSYSVFAIVDTESNEILMLEAGYSE